MNSQNGDLENLRAVIEVRVRASGRRPKGRVHREHTGVAAHIDLASFTYDDARKAVEIWLDLNLLEPSNILVTLDPLVKFDPLWVRVSGFTELFQLDAANDSAPGHSATVNQMRLVNMA